LQTLRSNAAAAVADELVLGVTEVEMPDLKQSALDVCFVLRGDVEGGRERLETTKTWPLYYKHCSHKGITSHWFVRLGVKLLIHLQT
jgi:hypothetical protein